MRIRRLLWKTVASLAVLVLLLGATGFFVVRSQWFYEKLRARIVSTVETATGGRAEAASFRFDWRRMRAEIASFALHGDEPEGKPVLFRASSIAVGLKIVSAFKRDVDIQYLDVVDPQIHLIIYPDGRTNIPRPKIKTSDRSPIETLLNLAVGRFDLRNGVFAIEERGRTPFEARGEKLNLKLLYEMAGPRYRGDLSMQPLEVRWPGLPPVPFGVNLAVTLEGNRIGVAPGRLTTGDSRIEFSGWLDDLSSPRASFRYDARVALADVSRIAGVEELERGRVEIAGEGSWAASSTLAATGKLHAYDVDYRDNTVALRHYRADGDVTAGAQGLEVNALRLSGSGPCPARAKSAATVWPCGAAVGGRIANVTLRGRDLVLRGIGLSSDSGKFQGEARLSDLTRYSVSGEIAGFEARRTVAAYSPEPLPWDARAAGTIKIEGALRRKSELRIAADLAITPAPEGSPVSGHITATYEALSDTLDLARSNLTLPSTRAEFSGAVPPVQGRELRVHLESRDLNDILPALGQSAAKIPVKLAGGSATFDGTVTGNLKEPHIGGHVNVTKFVYEERPLDSLQADVTVSPAGLEARNATVTSGTVRAQFQGSIGLHDWKIDDTSPIAGSGSTRNADLAALVPLLATQETPATGVLTATAQFSGTVGEPHLAADVEIAKGSFQDEPFDRFTGRVNYAGRTLQVVNGRIGAAGKEIELAGTFEHAASRFDEGRLRFRVSTNPMLLEQIQFVQRARPGARGTVQVTANGDVDLGHSREGLVWRIADLQADIAARALQLAGQPLGDAHLTAESKAAVLHAHLESDFAGSQIRGDGQWRLEENYPGNATVVFSRLDFARLRQWLSTGESTLDNVAGFAEGELKLDGPAWQMDALKAQLRITQFEVAAAEASASGAPAAASGSLKLQNSGPILASMANKVITVDSARLVGRSTDLNVSGKVFLEQKNALDLRFNGRLDLAIVQDFNHDFVSSGTVTAEAVIRGPFESPQMNGRLQFQNAAFSIGDVPNGISNANGVVLLTNELRGQVRENRGTIQSFTGETGGGKIQVSGFGAYSSGQAIVQLHATAREVRVRYPEGVSTVADANLDLTGTGDRSQLSGTITVLRTGFNLQSDISSLIAKSAEPVRTPAAHNDFLGGMNFDVQIETAPDIQFQSSLTEDLQVEANLRLRGTFSNPALLGRVNVTQGQVVFYGTKYHINQGSVAFYNALKVEPILDIDLETKAHGIDITLTVSGPLNKLSLTPRSDPPLQFNEIVALLATGRTPTSDPTLLTHQSTAPQSWQQMGASALLGQAIANPVAGRLQRFFGVSKLRIDPTIAGVENNPQARLTLEQQVTQDITFTYITNVTSTNPQVVRMEWSFSKQWSVVALREENGTFGLDFFFKKRF